VHFYFEDVVLVDYLLGYLHGVFEACRLLGWQQGLQVFGLIVENVYGFGLVEISNHVDGDLGVGVTRAETVEEVRLGLGRIHY